MKTKKNIHGNNKTKKCRPSQKELKTYCREHANTFNQFEEEYEKTFKESLKKEDANIEKKLIQLFKTPFTPSKYKAQDDYYTYINYQWLANKSAELKKELKHYVQVDSFRIVQEKVYYELIDIVKEYVKKNDTKKSRAINNVYTSLLNLDNK
jgi:hypothetical protein